MLQKTYSIYSDSADNGRLCIEAGKNHLACWRKDAENRLTAFEFFQCDAYTGSSFDNLVNAAKLHSTLLTQAAEAPQFILNTDEALCIPLNRCRKDDDFIKQNLNMLFGPCANADFFSEEHGEFLFASRVNQDLQNSVRSSFPSSQFRLQYACLLPSLIANGNEDILYLFFYPYYFSLAAFKEGHLQLLQTRAYNVAEDVLYFVLNVLKQYDIPKEAEIITGGFVDEQSKLYQTLYQYLEGLKPASVDEALFATGEFKDYSSHYFLPYASYIL